MKQAWLIVLPMFSFYLGQTQTKTPILERKISIEISNEKLPVALSRIAQEGKFSFGIMVEL